MPTVKDVYEFLNSVYPFSTQMSFDNAGLLVGRQNAQVSRVLLSLDITPAVAREAVEKGAELIVSHHPVIFFPVKSVTDTDPVGLSLLTLIENHIAAICAHTNLDKAPGGVNDALAHALGLSNIGYLEEAENLSAGVFGIGRFGTLLSEVPLEDFAQNVKEALNANGVRFASCGKSVKKVAVGGGACHDYIKKAIEQGCDTFVTADLKYNDFLDAADLGINLVDAGHFPTENIVMPELTASLKGAFPDVEFIASTHREVIQYI